MFEKFESLVAGIYFTEEGWDQALGCMLMCGLCYRQTHTASYLSDAILRLISCLKKVAVNLKKHMF